MNLLSQINIPPLDLTIYGVQALMTGLLLLAMVVSTHLFRVFIGRMVTDMMVRQRYWTLSRNLHLILGIVLTASVWMEELKVVGLVLTGLLAAFFIANKEVVLGISGRLSLAVTEHYTIGDRITINGVTGDVINIGLLYTWLLEVAGERGEMQSTGRVVWIPHLWLHQHFLVNQTHFHHYNWDEIDFNLPLDADLPKALALCRQEAETHQREEMIQMKKDRQLMEASYAAKLPPITPVTYLRLGSHVDGEQYAILTLRYSVKTRERRERHTQLVGRLLEKLAQAGIELKTHHGEDERHSLPRPAKTKK